jgi:Leucine-rich repeat (LRR) protein
MHKYFILIFAVYFIFYSCVAKKDNGNNNKEKSETAIVNEIGARASLRRLGILRDSKKLLIKSEKDINFIENIPDGFISEYIEEITVLFLDQGWDLNLSFIERFPKLKRLSIFGDRFRNNILKFDSLKYLNDLEYLTLHNLNISDISPIADLGNLTELVLKRINKINDISSIAYLTNLTRLWLIELTQINDISFLSKLKNLKDLEIIACGNIENIHIILELENLESLRLDIISQDFLNGIVKLKKLKKLTMHMATFDDVSPLLLLPDLFYIYFSYFPYDKISLLTPLATSNSLKKITIDNGSFEKLNDFLKNEGKIFAQNGIKIFGPSGK